MIELTRKEVVAVQDCMKLAEKKVYADVGLSPGLVSPILEALREGIDIVDSWLKE